MCGRYVRKSAQELLAEWFDLDLHLMPWFTASYNAAPQRFQPVVWLDPESSQRRISWMRWGLVPSWAKNERVGLSTISACAEEVAAKPAFREELKKRRCLIPAAMCAKITRLDWKLVRVHSSREHPSVRFMTISPTRFPLRASSLWHIRRKRTSIGPNC